MQQAARPEPISESNIYQKHFCCQIGTFLLQIQSNKNHGEYLGNQISIRQWLQFWYIYCQSNGRIDSQRLVNISYDKYCLFSFQFHCLKSCQINLMTFKYHIISFRLSFPSACYWQVWWISTGSDFIEKRVLFQNLNAVNSHCFAT